MILPVPANYTNWQSWAVKLLDALRSITVVRAAHVQIYTVATVPAPIEDGMLIGVSNEIGGTTIAISFNGKWLRVSDGTEISA